MQREPRQMPEAWRHSEGNRRLFDRPVIILPDHAHSKAEEPLRAVGRTAAGRHVFLVFTVRERGGEEYIGPISARYMHQKEIDGYEEDQEGPT